ncbi:MAG: hypothetical protein HYY91_06290 [Candidatus Omnitrophica bacterium]|nr:hypothetical protein [Candidatus Omnitrophota bacterium]
MSDSLQAYRDAVATHVHGICLDRNLDPRSSLKTEAACRIDRYLPELVELAKAAGPRNGAGFEIAVEHTICLQCGHQSWLGACQVRENAECCLYRYLPLVYDAIQRVDAPKP